MRKKTSEIPHCDITNKDYDSWDEVYFVWWLEELKSKHIILDYRHYTKGVNVFDSVKYYIKKELKTKTKVEERSLLSGMQYTPDFGIIWNPKYINIFFNRVYTDAKIAELNDSLKRKCHILNVVTRDNQSYVSYIDIKNPFDFKGMRTGFHVKQKILFAIKHKYIQEIEVKKIFYTTFTPERYFKTNSGKSNRKVDILSTRTLQQYLNETMGTNT